MTRLDDRALMRIRSGDRAPELRHAAEQYVGRMAQYFARRAARVTGCIDADDLAQLGRLALVEAVTGYHWRCTRCMLASPTEEGFLRHSQRRHPGEAAIASPTILRHTHALVGRAMDHEVRRYVRRDKFHGELPRDSEAAAGYTQWTEAFARVEPNQEYAAEIALALRALARGERDDRTKRLNELLRRTAASSRRKQWAG